MHIHSDKSYFKAKKCSVTQEYHYRWWKMGLFWQSPMQKLADWQGLISIANSKSGASWNKSYDEITVVLFILIFWTTIRRTMQIYSLHSCNVCMKNLRKWPALLSRRNIVLLLDYAGKTIRFKLVHSTPSIIFSRTCTKWFLSCLFFSKCEWQNFLKKINIWG